MFILSLLHYKIFNNIEQVHFRRVLGLKCAVRESELKLEFNFCESFTFRNCFRMFKNW